MSDIDPLEREKNLLRLAEEGCVVAVVENEQTNQEHCVEVYQRQDGIWHSRIKTFNLQKQNVGNYPSMDPFPSIAILSRIGHEVRGRWLGIFKSMSAPERSAWVREKQDRRKRCREAISGSMRRSLNGLKDAIQEFIRERDLPAQVWRGHLDDLRVKVEGYETLEVMAAIQCGSLQTWVQTPDVIRFAYCSCHMNKKGIAEVVLFFSVSWREKQRVSLLTSATYSLGEQPTSLTPLDIDLSLCAERYPIFCTAWQIEAGRREIFLSIPLQGRLLPRKILSHRISAQ